MEVGSLHLEHLEVVVVVAGLEFEPCDLGQLTCHSKRVCLKSKEELFHDQKEGNGNLDIIFALSAVTNVYIRKYFIIMEEGGRKEG